MTDGRLIRLARFYDPFVWLLTLGRTRSLRAAPLDLAALRPGERVLEVGCGTGEVALRAARRVRPGGLVVGIDAAPEMIAVARRKARGTAHFEVQPVEAMSFPAGSFDVVLSSLMMHHLPGALKVRALGEVRRVLRPGGRLVIVDIQAGVGPLRIWQPGGLAGRIHRQQGHAAAGTGLPDLAALLREAGFVAVQTGATASRWLGYARGEVPHEQ
ncbi:MAG TPA: methyltransferase domain-containing protein [Chloroflexia bacterium]|nr:methyltransferase domain-containing protein [Chloroflexia bacterium]